MYWTITTNVLNLKSTKTDNWRFFLWHTRVVLSIEFIDFPLGSIFFKSQVKSMAYNFLCIGYIVAKNEFSMYWKHQHSSAPDVNFECIADAEYAI